MIASSNSSHLPRVPRWVAACRVLAIAIAVLSLGGQGIASRVVAASATAAIAASSAEWRAAAAVHERASDAAWAGADVDGMAPALLPAPVSWELGPAALARVLDWAPAPTERPAARHLVAHVARGPPGNLS